MKISETKNIGIHMRSYGRSFSCARSSLLSRSCSPNAPSSRSQVRRPRRRLRSPHSGSPSKSSLPHGHRRRKRSRLHKRSLSHVAPPGGGHSSWSPSRFTGQSPQSKNYSQERDLSATQPGFNETYRYYDLPLSVSQQLLLLL